MFLSSPGRAAALCVAALAPVCAVAPTSAADPLADDSPPLVTLEGSRVASAAVFGEGLKEGPLVVLFWSLYQPSSRRALRDLDRLTRESSLAGAIGIAIPEYRERPGAISDFLDRARIELPVWIDPSGEVAGAFRASVGRTPALPDAYLLRPGGAITHLAEGWHDAYGETLGRTLRHALREPESARP